MTEKVPSQNSTLACHPCCSTQLQSIHGVDLVQGINLQELQQMLDG